MMKSFNFPRFNLNLISHRPKSKNYKLFVLLLGALLSSCAVTPPQNKENLCELFREKPEWYEATLRTYQKWGVPIHVQMAIMFQESSFIADARPPANWLGIRPSTAYGYAQALDQTWENYLSNTGIGNAYRDDFDDASDFVGWYCNLSYMKLGLSKLNADPLYLAYHEGHGGYKRGTYLQKDWLISTAKRVAMRANNYREQLSRCWREF